MRPRSPRLAKTLPAEILTALAEQTVTVAGTSDFGRVIAGVARQLRATWNNALQGAGRRLGDAAADGDLQRGLRDVLAHHVIFMWNRFGIPSRAQTILAHAVADTMMNRPPIPTGPRQGTDVAATHRP